jgi:hypothetical protein
MALARVFGLKVGEDGEARGFVQNKETGEASWSSNLFFQKTARARFYDLDDGYNGWSSKAWLYDLPRGVSECQVFFEVCYFQFFIQGVCRKGWITHRWKNWAKSFKALRMHLASHLHRSASGATQIASAQTAQLSGVELAEHGQEAVVSSAGSVILLAHAAASHAKKIDQEVEGAHSTLECFFDVALRNSNSILELERSKGGYSLFVQLQGARVQRETALQIVQSKYLPAAACDIDGTIHLKDVVMGCVKSGALRGAGSHRELATIASGVGDIIELSRFSAEWLMGQMRKLPKLRGGTGEVDGGRSSIEYKQEVMEVAATVPGMDANRMETAVQAWQERPDEEQLSDADPAMEGVDPLGVEVVAPEQAEVAWSSDDGEEQTVGQKRKRGSQKKFEWPVMMQALFSARLLFPAQGNLFLNLDGVRTFMGELVQVLAFSSVARLCIWLPIQVSLSGLFRQGS